MMFRNRLIFEFHRRRRANSRYSLRSFANSLNTDHSTLSKLLSNDRRLTCKSVRTLGSQLGIDARQIEEYCALEDEDAVLAAIDHARFRPNSRWIAVATGIPLDAVNVALHRLLRKGRLAMLSKQWVRASCT